MLSRSRFAPLPRNIGSDSGCFGETGGKLQTVKLCDGTVLYTNLLNTWLLSGDGHTAENDTLTQRLVEFSIKLLKRVHT